MSDDLLNEFIFDSRDHLGVAGAQLLDLEKNPGALDSLNALLGTLHTIKGNSGFLDLKNLYHLMHQAESLLQTIREKRISCPQPVIDLLLQVLDTAEAILSRLEGGEDDAVDWLEALRQALGEADARLEADQLPEPVADPPSNSPEADFSEAAPAASLFKEGDPAGRIDVLALNDGDLDRAGADFPARVEAMFHAGLAGLTLDLRTLTSLTARELKLLLAVPGEGRPAKTAFLVDRAGQPGLWRLFQELGLDDRWPFFSEPEPALAFLKN